MTLIGWLSPDRDDGWINAQWLAMARIGDELELEDVIERAWLARVLTPARKRQRFPPRVLVHYPLTQPDDSCQRCLRSLFGFGVWDLDHIVELQFGGIDHPSNLVRLCRPCHKAKPYPPESMVDAEEIRRFVLAWVRRGPAGGEREPWDGSL
ncbi:MAG TPA: HNH endonuclease signature motif containing protein [Candidatus Limnocylindrales bacterium]